MGWTNLIAGMTRIIDAYDSQREVGSSNTQPGPELRRHNATGIYCEIGIVILEYLGQKDEEVARDYVPIKQIYYENEKTFHEIDDKIVLDDIVYVVNLFASPIPLKFRIQPIKGTNQTALFERAKAGGDVRISKMGQFIRYMAGIVDDMINIDFEVQKLSRDLEDGRFEDFFKHSENSIKIIIKNTREIYLYNEMPALAKKKVKFLENKDRYLDTLKKTSENIIDVNDKLNASYIKEKIHVWSQAFSGDYDVEFRLRNQVKRLRAAVNKFSKAFQDFLYRINEIENHVIQTVDFYDACKRTIQGNILNEKILRSLFVLNGLWTPEQLGWSGCDFFRNVQVPVIRDAVSMTISSDQETNPDAVYLDSFIKENREYLAGKLAEGEVPLSHLVRDGILVDEDISRFASIVGLCIKTNILGLDHGKILVSVKANRAVKQSISKNFFEINDLALVYLRGNDKGD